MSKIRNKAIISISVALFSGVFNVSLAQEPDTGMENSINNAQIMLPDEMPEPDLTKADRFIVKYKENQNPGIQLYNNEDIDEVDYSEGAYDVIYTDEAVDIDEFSNEMMDDYGECIEYIQPDYRMDLQSTDSSPAETHTATDIKFDEDTSISDCNEDIIVAVIDTGVDINHNAIKNSIYVNAQEKDNSEDNDNNGYISDVCGWDFYNDSNVVYNSDLGLDQAHGTHISSVISDVAPNAKILPLKVFENGEAYTSDIIEAINYAEQMGAKIVNCSWGSTNENRALEEAIENSDMVFVCAVGNNRLDLTKTPIYPAAFNLDNVVAVSSVNDDGGLSYFSNYGSGVDITAPGRDITGAFPENSEGELSGTSVSAAFVSGALSLCCDNGNVDINKMYGSADKLLNLQGYVKDGRRLNVNNIVNNIISDEIIDLSPEEDFNTEGYSRTPEESWTLFNSVENVEVTAGENFVAVLKSDGSVWTWGNNDYGQLGIGSFETRTVPQQVQSVSNVVEIDAGRFHVLARTSNGQVYAWGSNTKGELGNGTKTRSCVPKRMIGISNVTSISAAGNYSCVLNSSGDVYMCGHNGWKQLGDGTTTDRTTLIEVSIPESIKFIEVDAGAAFAISTTGGRLYSWGHNGNGRLGDGGTTDRATPQVIIDGGIVDMDMGMFDGMALTESGQVYEWGYGKGNTPSLISGISNVDDINAGRQAQFIIQDGIIKGRGMNNYGQVGAGDTTWNNSWRTISGTYEEFDIDNYTAIAIGTNGYIYTWGLLNEDTGTYITSPAKLDDRINDPDSTDFDNATDINSGITYGNMINVNDEHYYKFTPTSSGTYLIKSVSNIDPACKIYTKNSSGSYSLFANNDDNSRNNNVMDFYISKSLNAGTEYYILIYTSNGSSAVNKAGEYNLSITKQ